LAEGLGARTAPDDSQDGGQGSVIVGDNFKRPVYTSPAEKFQLENMAIANALQLEDVMKLSTKFERSRAIGGDFSV